MQLDTISRVSLDSAYFCLYIYELLMVIKLDILDRNVYLYLTQSLIFINAGNIDYSQRFLLL